MYAGHCGGNFGADRAGSAFGAMCLALLTAQRQAFESGLELTPRAPYIARSILRPALAVVDRHGIQFDAIDWTSRYA